jgi:hypothetical protein
VSSTDRKLKGEDSRAGHERLAFPWTLVREPDSRRDLWMRKIFGENQAGPKKSGQRSSERRPSTPLGKQNRSETWTVLANRGFPTWEVYGIGLPAAHLTGTWYRRSWRAGKISRKTWTGALTDENKTKIVETAGSACEQETKTKKPGTRSKTDRHQGCRAENQSRANGSGNGACRPWAENWFMKSGTRTPKENENQIGPTTKAETRQSKAKMKIAQPRTRHSDQI